MWCYGCRKVCVIVANCEWQGYLVEFKPSVDDGREIWIRPQISVFS